MNRDDFNQNDPRFGDIETTTPQPLGPVMPTGPITDPNDPRLSNPAFASDPEVQKFLSGIYGPGGSTSNKPDPNATWNPSTQTWTPGAPTPTQTTNGATGPSGTTNTGLGSLFQPFGQSYTAPAPVNLGGPAGIPYIPQVPQLNLPQRKQPPPFAYDDFQMPSTNDVYQDPSYLLRKQEGESGIMNNAAAKGLVRSGGNLMDILKYNQGFASNEYGNIVDRKFKQYDENRANAVDTYRTNYQTQYVDPYSFDVQAAKDLYAPLFSQWQTQSQAGQRQNELNNAQSWDQFLQNYRTFDDDRKFKAGVLSDQERIGLQAALA